MKKADLHAKQPETVTAGNPDGMAALTSEPLAEPQASATDLTPEQLNELKARAAKADEH